MLLKKLLKLKNIRLPQVLKNLTSCKMVSNPKSGRYSHSSVVVIAVIVVAVLCIGLVHGDLKGCVKWCDNEYIICVNQGETIQRF